MVLYFLLVRSFTTGSGTFILLRWSIQSLLFSSFSEFFNFSPDPRFTVILKPLKGGIFIKVFFENESQSPRIKYVTLLRLLSYFEVFSFLVFNSLQNHNKRASTLFYFSFSPVDSKQNIFAQIKDIKQQVFCIHPLSSLTLLHSSYFIQVSSKGRCLLSNQKSYRIYDSCRVSIYIFCRHIVIAADHLIPKPKKLRNLFLLNTGLKLRQLTGTLFGEAGKATTIHFPNPTPNPGIIYCVVNISVLNIAVNINFLLPPARVLHIQTEFASARLVTYQK